MKVVETLGQVPTITHTVAVADFAVIFQYPNIFILNRDRGSSRRETMRQ